MSAIAFLVRRFDSLVPNQWFAGQGLKARAIRGSAWTLAGYGISQATRLLSNLILTRILFPEAFGLMALVQVFAQGLQMFSDIGIGPAIVQHTRGDDPDFLNTAWTIQVVRGVLLTVIACLIGYPVALLYREPMLAQLLPAVGVTSLILGFKTTKVFTAKRHLALGRLTLVEVASKLITVASIVLLAWNLRSVWALVIGALIGALVSVLLSQAWLTGISNRFCWDPTAARELIRFGRWIFVSTVFSFLGRQGDRLIFASLFPITWLGVYSIAMLLMTSASGILMLLTSQVGYSVFARLNHLSESEFRERLLPARRRVILGWAVVCAVFILCADPLVHQLWDNRYSDAGWMASILGFALWPFGLMRLSSMALTSRGEPRFQAFGQIAATIGLVAFVPLGFHLHGEVLAIFGVVFSYLLAYFVTFSAGVARGVIDARSDVIGHLLLGGLLLIGGLSRWLLGLPAVPWVM